MAICAERPLVWWCVKMGRCMTLACGVPLCMLTYTHSPIAKPPMAHACNMPATVGATAALPCRCCACAACAMTLGGEPAGSAAMRLGAAASLSGYVRVQCVPSLLAAAVVVQEVSCARVTCSGLEAQRIGIPSRG